MSDDIVEGFVSIFSSKVLVIVVGLVTTPLLVRLLGTSRYGDYAFLLSVLGVTMILTNAGIFDGARKYIAERRGDSGYVEQVFAFYLRVAVLLAGVASLVFLLLSRVSVGVVPDGEFERYFVILGVLVVGRQLYSVARGGLMGLGLENRSEPIYVLRKVLFAVFGLSLAYVGYGLVGVLAGHVLSVGIVSVISYAILSRHIRLSAVLTRASDELPKGELLSFNTLSVVLILLTASLYHVDILVLRVSAGDRVTGLYKAALVVAEFLWFVPNALQTVLLHSSSEMWSNERSDEISRVVSKITRYNLVLLLLIVTGLAALAGDFVSLYFGPEFESSITPLVLLLPGALGFALARPIFAVGQGKGELGVLVLATGVAALVNLCLNLVLIPRYGMVGAAAATSTSYGLMLALHVLAALRIGFTPVADLRIPRIVVISIVSGSVVFLLSSAIESAVVSLVVVPPSGFVVHMSLMLRYSVVPREDAETVAQYLPQPFRTAFRRMTSLVSKETRHG